MPKRNLIYGERNGNGYKVIDHLLYFKLKVYSQLHVGTSTKIHYIYFIPFCEGVCVRIVKSVNLWFLCC